MAEHIFKFDLGDIVTHNRGPFVVYTDPGRFNQTGIVTKRAISQSKGGDIYYVRWEINPKDNEAYYGITLELVQPVDIIGDDDDDCI